MAYSHQTAIVQPPWRPGSIKKIEKPRRWSREGEKEMGVAAVMLLYVGHQMLNLNLI